MRAILTSTLQGAATLPSNTTATRITCTMATYTTFMATMLMTTFWR